MELKHRKNSFAGDEAVPNGALNFSFSKLPEFCTMQKKNILRHIKHVVHA
jgi:hypothetical protein